MLMKVNYKTIYYEVMSRRETKITLNKSKSTLVQFWAMISKQKAKIKINTRSRGALHKLYRCLTTVFYT